MFRKIHLAFYDMLFEIYGKLCEYYLAKSKEDKEHDYRWRRKARKCVNKRDDILEIMFALRGLN